MKFDERYEVRRGHEGHYYVYDLSMDGVTWGPPPLVATLLTQLAHREAHDWAAYLNRHDDSGFLKASDTWF
jgi:hypothetical protein